MSEKIRNLAIIAHVDHGKTTLVDKLLEAGGVYHENQAVSERAMDSMDQEKERGITIKAKNTAIHWNDYIINLVDTPGHADFGAEVERVMKMVDSVLLVVDAYEGPQAQTRFVLRKALAEGIRPIIVVNKVDRDHAEPEKVKEQVLELLLDLGASDEQFDAPVIYGSAKSGFFVRNMADDQSEGVIPLLEEIIKEVPAPNVQPDEPFKMLISNIDWDNYVGRVAIGRIESGSISKSQNVYLLRKDGSKVRAQVTKMFEYTGLGAQEADKLEAGNIVGIAGIEEVDIGETLAEQEDAEALPFVSIDPPTVQMGFSINDGPFGGLDGKHVTSRAIRDRLFKETKTNISISVEDTDTSGCFNVSARGIMQISVLVETMRREGFEVLISRPSVITIENENGKKQEPYSTLFIEVPEEAQGATMKLLSSRKGIIQAMEPSSLGINMEAIIPTRGLIGFEIELMNITSGHGVMSNLFLKYDDWAGEIVTRHTGALISMARGKAMTYSMLPLEARGRLFIEPGMEIYEGQIVGESSKLEDLLVNPVKEKNLTNHRASGKDNTTQLAPAVKFSLERAIEYIADDELVEITPNHIRLRKRYLDPNERKRLLKKSK